MVFVARIGEPNLEETELIHWVKLPFPPAVPMVMRGEITPAPSGVLILKVALKKIAEICLTCPCTSRYDTQVLLDDDSFYGVFPLSTGGRLCKIHQECFYEVVAIPRYLTAPISS